MRKVSVVVLPVAMDFPYLAFALRIYCTVQQHPASSNGVDYALRQGAKHGPGITRPKTSSGTCRMPCSRAMGVA